MAKLSAGILLYKRDGDAVQVMLGHPGGPFWAKKDDGAWSVPKGEVADGEDMLAAAKREFAEEMGSPVPEALDTPEASNGGLIDLGDIKISTGKVIHVWALEHDFDATTIKSNTFEMAWPPKSGQMQTFPEVDRAAWFSLAEAPAKMHSGQSVFVERLAEKLGVTMVASEESQTDHKSHQTSLF